MSAGHLQNALVGEESLAKPLALKSPPTRRRSRHKAALQLVATHQACHNISLHASTGCSGITALSENKQKEIVSLSTQASTVSCSKVA